MVRVLVADDSALVRERLIALLSDLEGIEIVGQACTPGETLGSVQKSEPDVVVLDLRMIDRHGLEVVKEIKATTIRPAIIVLSTFPYPQYRKKCEQMGADFFLDKTTDIHQVAELIDLLGEE